MFLYRHFEVLPKNLPDTLEVFSVDPSLTLRMTNIYCSSDRYGTKLARMSASDAMMTTVFQMRGCLRKVSMSVLYGI